MGSKWSNMRVVLSWSTRIIVASCTPVPRRYHFPVFYPPRNRKERPHEPDPVLACALTHAPTPLEHLANLSRHLGGPEIYVKRDDATGLTSGGNKTRKLEFLVGEALSLKASHLITHGATQSNHVRQTVAAACKFGLGATALLEERVAGASPGYYGSGSVFLDRLFGATLETRPPGLDLDAECAVVGEHLRRLLAAGAGLKGLSPASAMIKAQLLSISCGTSV
jgi:hypothetical protein